MRVPFSLLFLGIIALTPDAALSYLVSLIGIYVGLRGVLLLAVALRPGSHQDRRTRAAIGLAGMAFGVLAFSASEAVSLGVIVGGAIAAILLGGIVLAHGLRIPRPWSSGRCSSLR